MSVEIESLVTVPRLFDDIDPFLRVVVARIVLALLHAEHLELALVPADHDIDADPALADVVGGDEFLGRDQRMKQRCVDRAEYGHALGGAEQAYRPGNRFKRPAVKIGVAAVTLPARDRQHEIEAGLVREPGQSQAVGPTRRPALRHFGGGAAG